MTQTSPPARTRLRIAAAVVGGGLVVSTLLIGPAAVADPAGHLRAGTWTVDGQRATTQLPAELAGLGDVVAVNQDAAQSALVVTSGASTGSLQLRPSPGAITAARSCLTGQAALVPVTCATYGSDITFPEPVVDPVLRLSTAGGAMSSGSNCSLDWYDISVSGIDGAPADPSRLSLEESPNGWALQGDTITRPSQPSRLPCTAPTAGAMSLKIHGVVRSVHLDNAFRAIVNYGSAIPVSTFQGVAVQVLLPTTDLVAEASAPALVPAEGTAAWTFSVRNDGPADSHGYVLTAQLPAGVTNVVAPDGCTVDGTTVTCTTVPAGASAERSTTVPTFAALTNPTGTADSVLAAGATAPSIVVRATTPADRDADLSATALVSGVDLDTAPASNATEVTSAVQRPALTLTKGADRTAVSAAGESLGYRFDVRNTGDAALTDLAIDEGRFSGTGSLGPVRCDTTELQADESTTCSAPYTVTTDDAKSDAITNTATASALPAGEPRRIASAASSVSVAVNTSTGSSDGTGGSGSGAVGDDDGGAGDTGAAGSGTADSGAAGTAGDADVRPSGDGRPVTAGTEAAPRSGTAGTRAGSLAYTGAEIVPLAAGAAIALIAGLTIAAAAAARRRSRRA
ncbi:DUF11 domain-containing protein [Curtobacterium pusillum]|uniref:DUF7507 domain-containing protein n=1 Tax=Curtobacterium pusillum TaxID=69373 RepID=UPI001643F559|nr:DUF11 domain-containing protein [Curtobacterium pusillum]